ncbi:hypothetical protein QYQ98_07770 [Corynebacterium sp. P3-F1]|uniref:hypothetical protein n=1 Tax=Corynebacterium sp. P3-F1 TaxID=3059080 RepID=UPI00265D4BDF|nr:hypothetical protein [Corynebacterium sp. P3-F1]WKK60926.1 hypothetical protein QYQ98_07770 [Corynebacterium sp. P3-F1]
MYAYDVRNRVTPIPTPLIVRTAGSAGAAGSVAVMVSQLATGPKVLIALGCAALAIAVTLLHPYRGQMRAFAEEKKVDTVPSISMLVPLMLWWLALMLAPLAQWPTWGAVLVFVIVTAAAWVLYPHVDGSRRLAYAD